MKLYAFDGIDSSLPLVPIAARRALDSLGAKLSLAGFQSLPHSCKQSLTEAGSASRVDTEMAREAIAAARPPAEEMAPVAEPSELTPPDHVLERLGPTRPLPEKVWQSLSALDRYALAKVTDKKNEERLRLAYEEIVGKSSVSTHVRPQGGVVMVAISEKPVSLRRARAESWIKMSATAYHRLIGATAPKGDVLGTARLAGIMATKKTADIIPLCHPLALQHAEIDFEEHADDFKLRVLCAVTVEAKTGVEMEAMVGASVAALTVYDMLKSIDRGMELGPTRLLEKSGGRSGTFTRGDES